MSTRAPRRRENFKPPADWILAKPILVDHEWYVEVEKRGATKRYAVDEAQSWNVNLFVGLEVYVKISGKTCTVMRRAHQNKQFVKI